MAAAGVVVGGIEGVVEHVAVAARALEEGR